MQLKSNNRVVSLFVLRSSFPTLFISLLYSVSWSQPIAQCFSLARPVLPRLRFPVTLFSPFLSFYNNILAPSLRYEKSRPSLSTEIRTHRRLVNYFMIPCNFTRKQNRDNIALKSTFYSLFAFYSFNDTCTCVGARVRVSYQKGSFRFSNSFGLRAARLLKKKKKNFP